jgi:hypothetical protein
LPKRLPEKNDLMLTRTLLAAITCVIGATSTCYAQSQVRLNQIQVIGTHNSYHIQPHPSVMELIRQSSQKQAASIEYTHRPLAEQFSELGIRQIELDVYADPKGGHYAKPMALKLVADAKLPPVPDPDPDGELLEPGLKIIHAPDIDFFTTVRTFVGALKQIKQWSEENPTHIPIMVMVEVKQSRILPMFPKPMPFDAAALDAIDEEISSVFPNDRIITPDSVRGESETLRDAVTSAGWPSLDDCRGRVIFALDNGGLVRDNYIKGHPALKGRILFASVDADHPSAAFMKLNDPVGGFDHIQEMVKQGFLVRTRADSGTRQARENDASTKQKAFASGAQYISTDYPEPDLELSEYRVELPDRAVARPNPINGNGMKIKTVGLQQ